MSLRPIRWPDGKRFAFTISDDPDSQSVPVTRLVYSFLADLGFRTTIGVWPLGAVRVPNSKGETCANPDYLACVRELQARGFEIGYHNATVHSSTREETIKALDRFREYFGHDPGAMSNHYNEEAIYWGPARLTGIRRSAYQLLTLGTKRGKHFGEIENHRCFWGDICRQRIRYCRDFVFSDLNTLRCCPWMPYADPGRPYVRYWYAASEGAVGPSFVRTIADTNQDRLEEEGGASIMYAHFGRGFVDNNRLHPEFRRRMERLARKNGWFAPVSTILDALLAQNGETELAGPERNRLEWRWLRQKIFRGTS